MIRINFPNSNQILTFDGEILELFIRNTSQRVHIGHVRDIQVNTDRKGSHQLVVTTITSAIALSFEQEQMSKVNELIAEVQKAKTSFKW